MYREHWPGILVHHGESQEPKASALVGYLKGVALDLRITI
jgi:hypothetical protein